MLSNPVSPDCIFVKRGLSEKIMNYTTGMDKKTRFRRKSVLVGVVNFGQKEFKDISNEVLLKNQTKMVDGKTIFVYDSDDDEEKHFHRDD